MTFQTILDRLVHDTNRQHKPDSVAEVLQDSYYEVCEQTGWADLRAVKELTPGSAALVLPSDLIQIMAVVGNTTGFPYVSRDRVHDARVRDYNLIWWFDSILKEPLHVNGGLSIDMGKNEATFGGLTVDLTGEYVQLGSEPGRYLVTACMGETVTISPRYWGPTLAGGNHRWQARPTRTRLIQFADRTSGENETPSETVTVHYWAYPPPLYQPDDTLAIPDKPVYLHALWMIRRFKSDAEAYYVALREAVAANPQFVGPRVPRGADRTPMLGSPVGRYMDRE